MYFEHKGTKFDGFSFEGIIDGHGGYELKTVGDGLDWIELKLKQNKNKGDLFDEIYQYILDFGNDKELKKLDNIMSSDFGTNGKLNKINTNIHFNDSDLIYQYYGYGKYYFFLKKDINKLKKIKSIQYTVSASSGSYTYGQKIKVKELEIYIPSKKESIIYTGDIKVFSDENEIGYSPLELLDL